MVDQQIWKGLLLESSLSGIIQVIFAVEGVHRYASKLLQQGEVKPVRLE